MLQRVVERLRSVDPGDEPFFGRSEHPLEWHTRYYLVDPLFRALGWDTALPQEVRVEWKVPGGGWADYALFAPGSGDYLRDLYVPKVLVEVKRRGAKSSVSMGGQLVEYVQGCPEMAGLAVMTDGMVWRIYRVQGGTLPTREPAETVDLCRGSAEAAAETLERWVGRCNWPSE